MLRKPKSRYENRRSKSLMKLKSWYDAEAILVGYEEGNSEGKWIGKVGSLILVMEDGVKAFTVSLNDLSALLVSRFSIFKLLVSDVLTSISSSISVDQD